MTPADHRRAGHLFEQLRNLPASDRTPALDAACAGNSELRSYVSNLLEADRAATGGAFLERRAIEDAAQLIAAQQDLTNRIDGGGKFVRADHVAGTLAAGKRWGPYEITGPLGAGGMGVVYRARDTKLHREVAIKMLPATLAEDELYMARFEREAQLLASLNHPNIATVYGIEQGALVMELVEGANLRGPLPVEEAIPIARQIAAGLEAAHERGVVHRDLKPANIRITPSGMVKLLDFGLATLAGESSPSLAPGSGPPFSPSPSPRMTQTGMILGTAAYMSPEQARGKPLDKRTDIWAFGAVLYEMLTGRQLFGRDSVADTLAAVVKETPDLDQLPADTPQQIVRLIGRCLRKDVGTRLRDIGEARVLLEETGEVPAIAAASQPPSAAPRTVAPDPEIQDALGRGPAWMLLGGVVTGMAIILGLAPLSTETGLAPLELSVDAMTAKAQAVAKKLGYREPPADVVSWFDRNKAFMAHRYLRLASPEGWRTLRDAEQSHQIFEYRQSPRPLNAVNWLSLVYADDPPPTVSGMVNLTLDARGPLLCFVAVPPQIAEASAGTPGDVEWTALFDESGLDRRRFKPEPPIWVAPVAFDATEGWEGTYAQNPAAPIHVIAASFHRKPVYFEVTGPWSQAIRQTRIAPNAMAKPNGVVYSIAVLGLLAVSIFVAQRNYRRRTGDAVGSLKVAGYCFFVFLARNVLLTDQGFTPDRVYFSFFENLGLALVLGMWVGLMYMSLEPYVRRHSPQLLVGWRRVLSGQFRDPVVGREILIGSLFGIAVALTYIAACSIPAWLDVRGWSASYNDFWALGRTNRFLALLCGWFADAVLYALFHTLLLFLALFAGRKRAVGLVLAWGAIAVLHLRGEAPALDMAQAAIMSALMVTVIYRYGMLACAATMYCAYTMWATPLTLVFSHWYAARSITMVSLCLGLAVYGFKTSLGGKSALATGLLDE